MAPGAEYVQRFAIAEKHCVLAFTYDYL
jgi:hypothetical protein